MPGTLKQMKAVKFLAFIILTGIFLTSCTQIRLSSTLPISTPLGEGFAIYLTRDDIPITQMDALSHVELAEEPLISAIDITAYDWETHEIYLSDTGKEKLQDFEVPIKGKAFLVCINKAPVYWGAFYNSLSSYYPFGTPVINMYPWNGNALTIEWDKISGDTTEPADPRNAAEIFASLQKWGKLAK
jgi:hypothetical protein